MSLDPYRVVVFVHVLLFAYWLGSDLGVFVCAMIGRRPGLSLDQRRSLREAADLIDMAPRTCLVLMAPVGLTLASAFGSPLRGGLPLAVVWIAALAWLWLVWQVHLEQGSARGGLYWKIDFAVRVVMMAAFVGFGGWCLISGGPIIDRWLSAKIMLFGAIIACGILVRLMLLASAGPTASPASPERAHALGLRIRNVVFVIWGLVAVIAFLGVTKPF